MPIPKPNENESQDDFIGRCMSAMKDEYPDQKQRTAICFDAWKKKKSDPSSFVKSLFIRKQNQYVREDMDFAEMVEYFKGITKDGNLTVDLMMYEDVEVKMSGEGYEWVMSDETVDRDFERIDQAGWDLKSFKKMPVVLWGHDQTRPAIGKVVNPKIKDGRLIGRVTFSSKEVDPFAWMVEQKIKEGILGAGSVGFKPSVVEFVENEKDPCKLIYRKQELREFSICNVPANPNALMVTERADDDRLEKLEKDIETLKTMQMMFAEKRYDKEPSYIDRLFEKSKSQSSGLNDLFRK